MPSDLNVQNFLRNSAIIVALVFLAYAALILWLTWPITTFSVQNAGTFGDSFGVLTSLFTGLGFAGLLTTILLQREDLKLSRTELQETRDEIRLQSETFYRQRFEDAFYRMLSLYKENLRDIAIRKEGETRVYGIDALTHLTAKFEQEWNKIGMEFPQHDSQKQGAYLRLLGATVQSVFIRQARYLETLSCILTLIDDECVPAERKHLYWQILTSQLTAHEVKYLFYQSLITADFRPLRDMILQSNSLQQRLATMNIQHGHRKAFELLWKIPLPKKRSPYASPFSTAEIRSLRQEQRRLRKQTKSANTKVDTSQVDVTTESADATADT